MNQLNAKTPAGEIKDRVRLLNLLITLAIVSFIFVIMRYVYEPIGSMLGFIPDSFMVVIAVIAVLISFIGLYISRLLTGQVVRIIEDYSSRLNYVFKITEDIRQEIYDDILLDKIMISSINITRSDAGSILLAEDENLLFKLVKGSRSQDFIGSVIPNNRGLCGWVFSNGEPLIAGDVSKDERFDFAADDITGSRSGSMLYLPLRTKSSVIGVIGLANRKNDSYSERDVEITGYLANHAAISLEMARFHDDQRNYEIHLTDILLDTIDRFIPQKYGHSKRVAKYANIIAKAAGFSEKSQRRLYFASLLHDIGFLKIFPTESNDKELFKMHPSIGYEMLSPISFYKDIALFIFHHHERYDGMGYPNGLKGEEIPAEARIIFIAEAFDTMASKLSYKDSTSVEFAVSEIEKNKGTQFDPEFSDIFLDYISKSLESGRLPVF